MVQRIFLKKAHRLRKTFLTAGEIRSLLAGVPPGVPVILETSEGRVPASEMRTETEPVKPAAAADARRHPPAERVREVILR